MLKKRIVTIILLVLGVVLGLNIYQTQVDGTNPFRLGLDLSGGSYLTYRADTSEVAEADVSSSMNALRDVIERRINAFGIAEPDVHTEQRSFGIEGVEQRLIVELPGVTDLDEAIELIGQTPLLEFKTEVSEEEMERLNKEISQLILGGEGTESSEEILEAIKDLRDQQYQHTELTGKYLKKAQLQFSGGGLQTGSIQSQPVVALTFTQEGAALFETITRENLGKTIAIYLDGQQVSAPRVNAAISGGQAVIQGNFSIEEIEEAKTLVGRLNSGALPIPIELISINSIGPSLGQDALDAGIQAGIIGFAVVALFLILWYRLPGLISVAALGIYTVIVLWLFKFIPVTLTSAGIVGFIISIGIAVDANILIFERMKEELQRGAKIYDAIEIGFKRAWTSIRDANISTIISVIILFWFGTPLIKGFALTFGIGTLVSMLTAITFSRLMLFSLNRKDHDSRFEKFLYGSGFNRSQKNSK